MLAIYINEALDVSRSRVFSVDNPVPIPAPEMVVGDAPIVGLYIVDGQGGYSAVSGADGTTVKVAIGDLTSAEPVWMNSAWMQIANGWTGILSTNTDEVAALLNGRNVATLSLRIVIVDPQGNPRTYALMPFRLWGIGIPTDMSASLPEGAQSGQFPIPDGVDAVTVTGLNLTAVPRHVIPFMIKPAGGANFYPSLIDETKTTDGFQIDLQGETDSANYKLGYFLIF
jgi:hypothetical protein